MEVLTAHVNYEAKCAELEDLPCRLMVNIVTNDQAWFTLNKLHQLVHSWMAPHIGFYKGGLTDQIGIAAHIGINGEFPSFMVHNKELNQLENLFQTNHKKLKK